MATVQLNSNFVSYFLAVCHPQCLPSLDKIPNASTASEPLTRSIGCRARRDLRIMALAVLSGKQSFDDDSGEAWHLDLASCPACSCERAMPSRSGNGMEP